MSSYFKNQKTILFYFLCLNFSIENLKLFLILYFSLSKKKQNGTLDTRIVHDNYILEL